MNIPTNTKLATNIANHINSSMNQPMSTFHQIKQPVTDRPPTRTLAKFRQRNGITLLFVVSMIVLFLLMGTTFVVVANQFFRDSKRRIQADIHTIDGQTDLNQALYDVLRGPSLDATDNPLRGQDVLHDMYGFGFSGIVNGTPTSGLRGQLIKLRLRSAAGNADQVTDLLSGSEGPLSEKPEHYTGHVLSFVSGPIKGVSTRIVRYDVFDNSGTLEYDFYILPQWTDRDPPALSALNGSRVIVNGRAFGGFGAGGFDTAAGETSPALGDSALEPNRRGINRATLTGSTGYLANYNGPSESYDGPDIQNMYLGGYGKSGNWLASFYRNSIGDATASSSATNRGSFTAFPLNDGTTFAYEVDNNNDGTNESFWMDTGAPVRTGADGLFYKPLVAYHIIDLDGRLNVNAVGNLADALDPNARSQYPGQGYGPAGISLTTFLGKTDYKELLQGDTTDPQRYPGRYGDNGSATAGKLNRDEWSNRKLFGYPDINKDASNTVGLGGHFQSSPMDLRGRFPILTPTGAIPFEGPNRIGFNNNLPMTDFTNRSTTYDAIADSPYESNFAPPPFTGYDTDDVPFTTREMEAWLRRNDPDSNLLDDRLKVLADSIVNHSSKRLGITTDSYEVPMAPFLALNDAGNVRSLLDILRLKIKVGTGNTSATDVEVHPYIRQLIAPELLRGMKMDVNRPVGNGRDDDSNGVVDDWAEYVGGQTNSDLASNPAMDLNNDGVPGTNDDLARFEFAKHLYVLTLLVTEDSQMGFASVADYRKAIAQWAINVVDFRDPDSIHTAFEYDPNPWNGWDTDGRVTVGEVDGTDRAVVWGAERPELLITETFAHHDRRTEDLDNDDGDGTKTDDTSNPDDDYDSRLVPHSSAFVELYHPWTQTNQNQRLPGELAQNQTSPAGVDLQKRSPNGDPVWRIGVKRDPAQTAFLRSVYFTDINATPPANTDPNAGEEFYTTLANVPVVAPGTSAVIGSSGTSTTAGGGYRTTFGRRSDSAEGSAALLRLDDTRSISLDPAGSEVQRTERDSADSPISSNKSAVVVVVDGPRSLSLSDPSGGYPVPVDPMDATTGWTDVGDGYAYNTPKDEPLDDSADAADLPKIWHNGVSTNFRTLYLQRLANPLADFNEDTNPYITIDVASADLLAFNGVENNPNNGAPTTQESAVNPIADGDTDFRSLERGESQTGANEERQLFARDFGVAPTADGTSTAGDMHNLSYGFVDSFGEINDAYVNNGNDPFAWLTWNNRPFASQLELANVPYAAPEDLTGTFGLRNTAANAYTTTRTQGTNQPASIVLGSQFGHLLNFYGFDDTVGNPTRGNFYRLFDYTEVPSRYVGTEIWLDPTDFPNHPFNFFSHYRYPGKINLNTIPNQDVYDTLMDSFNVKLTWTQFQNSRWRTVSSKDYFRPYRNTSEGNLVPDIAGATPGLVEENVDLGLYRRNGTGNALFDFDDTTPGINSDRSAYFRNMMRQRLGNLVTTRSSVFAIWITVGYFETNPDGSLKTDATGKGLEIGADTGTVTRNRGFYIVDRSIPVAVEPGQNHNVDRAILVRTRID